MFNGTLLIGPDPVGSHFDLEDDPEDMELERKMITYSVGLDSVFLEDL